MNRLSWGFLEQRRVQGLHDIIALAFCPMSCNALLVSANEHAAFFAISHERVLLQINARGSMTAYDKEGV